MRGSGKRGLHSPGFCFYLLFATLRGGELERTSKRNERTILPTAIFYLLGAILVLLVIVIFVLVRRGDSDSLVRRELGELRIRLDGMSASQNERLGEAGKAVADVRERLGALVEATRKLEAVGETVAEVQELLRVPKLRGMRGKSLPVGG